MRRIFPFLLCFLLCLAAAAGDDDDDDDDEAPAEQELTPDDIPARIATAEVGEWVLYRQANGNRLRLTVVEKWVEEDDTTLVILNEAIPKDRGRTRKTHEKISVKDAVADIRNLGEEDKVARADVLIQGKRMRVIVINFIKNGQIVRQSFLSPRIPVYGLVRGVDMTNNKSRVVLSIIDYGFAEEIIE